MNKGTVFCNMLLVISTIRRDEDKKTDNSPHFPALIQKYKQKCVVNFTGIGLLCKTAKYGKCFT